MACQCHNRGDLTQTEERVRRYFCDSSLEHYFSYEFEVLGWSVRI